MKVKLDINDSYIEPEIVIKASKIDDDIKKILNIASKEEKSDYIMGFVDDRMVVLNVLEIIRVYTKAGRVVAECIQGNFELKLRLYEAEEALERFGFVRISKSEIINLKHIAFFETEITGSLMVVFKNKEKSYVSRRYVKCIKERIGV